MSITNDRSQNVPRQDFESIKKGLSDPDVLTFINSLIEQNSDLANKLEQTDTLRKLAEERAKTARTEAERIIAEAKQIAESTQEKLSGAQQQAQEIIRTAEEQASKIISEAKQKAEAVSWQARQMLNSAKEKAEKEAILTRQEAPQLQPKTQTPPEKTPEVNPKKSQPDLKALEAKQVSLPSTQEGENQKKTTGFYDGTLELVIAPPISPGRLLTFGRQLKRTKQISIIGMKGSLTQGIRVRLFLRNRIPLFEVLKSIPQVEEVSGELKKASWARNPTEARDELNVKSILLRLKS